MLKKTFDVIVIGGGPAGLAAAISAEKQGARVALIDRERALGGILKQCIHDGFGLQRFSRQLTGPSYAQRFVNEIHRTSVEIHLYSFVFDLKHSGEKFTVMATSTGGILEFEAASVIVATGCIERTSKQVSIHGDRVSGVFNAGCIQNLVNLQGYLPGRRCAVLGSGDIGLIMARRLTLEGAEVIGVFEAKQTPSGLQRNISQCLDDFGIPLHLGCTVVRTHGERRLESIDVADTDEKMQIIEGTERNIPCDALIVSVGLIPELQIIRKLPVELDARTHGPAIDQNGMTSIDGLFCCGNASLVYDLVDYVSSQSEAAGQAAAEYAQGKTRRSGKLLEVRTRGPLMFVSPSFIDLNQDRFRLFFRSSRDLENQCLEVRQGDRILGRKTYSRLRPPQMEYLEFRKPGLSDEEPLWVELKEAGK